MSPATMQATVGYAAPSNDNAGDPRAAGVTG